MWGLGHYASQCPSQATGSGKDGGKKGGGKHGGKSGGKKVASLTAVASLAARAKRERAHLDTREKEMGQRKDVGPVADRISHINARRAMAKRDSRKAGYDHYVGCKQ